MDGGEQGTKRNEPSSSPLPHVQHLFVMRHGERLDDADPSWVPKTDRPWDPPLTERGKQQAWEVGKRLRTEGWGITRVVVSPFLRCVQTAAQVVTALCLVDDDDSSHHAAAPESSQDAVIDPSKVKVSIDYGLSELMNGKAIRNPPRGLVDSSTELHWTVPLEELHALLPTGSLDNSVQPTLSAVPAWGETTSAGHQRYSDIFQSIADKFSGENVLCISHGEGVGVSVMKLLPGVVVYGVRYCAYTQAQRTIHSHSRLDGLRAGDWELLTEPGPASGLLYDTFTD